MKVFVLYTDEFGERVTGNLINIKEFCEVCELNCEREICRGNYPSFAVNIYGLEKIDDAALPTFIENPEDYLPKNFPSGIDVLIVVGIHPDLLSALPEFAEENNIKALIIPVEDGQWVRLGLEKSITKECKERGIEVAFPRPACALEPSGQPTIDKFIEYFKIGKPKVRLNLDNDKVISYKVERTAPCGSTFYVCRQVTGKTIDELNEEGAEIISKAHHSFPCSASMVVDPVLEDTNLHIAGYLIRAAIFDELEKNSAKFAPKVKTLNEINAEA
ncbi:MAG: thymidylate synthase [Candidatus Helarchaeota archaeon]|nr:thymidylate synthase [Candidatus Helarchaeota archaeon]